MRSSSLAYSASGFGLLTIALCMSLGMAAPIVRLLSDPAVPSGHGRVHDHPRTLGSAVAPRWVIGSRPRLFARIYAASGAAFSRWWRQVPRIRKLPFMREGGRALVALVLVAACGGHSQSHRSSPGT